MSVITRKPGQRTTDYSSWPNKKLATNALMMIRVDYGGKDPITYWTNKLIGTGTDPEEAARIAPVIVAHDREMMAGRRQAAKPSIQLLRARANG